MKTVNYGERYSAPVTLCMGRYESVHRGHVQIIKKAASMAEKNGSELMLMTFDERDNPRFGRVILTYPERLARAESLGASSVLRINFTDKFKNTSAEDFLAEIFSALDIRGAACGYDFTYGAGKKGNAETLGEYCSKRKVDFFALPEIADGGEKISSSAVKKALSDGNIERANDLLGYKYFIAGKVTEGRREGRKMGFPTANIVWPEDKFLLKNGVYAVRSVIDGKEYAGICNFGAAPTFGFEKVICETHFKDFHGDLYGRDLTICFDAFLRDIRGFPTVEELKEQLQNDLKKI